jgi:hypothetical protein
LAAFSFFFCAATTFFFASSSAYFFAATSLASLSFSSLSAYALEYSNCSVKVISFSNAGASGTAGESSLLSPSSSVLSSSFSFFSLGAKVSWRASSNSS